MERRGVATYVPLKNMNTLKGIYQKVKKRTAKKKTSIKKEDIAKPVHEVTEDGYRKILYDWMADRIKPSTKAAEKAILKVSGSDTPKKDWSYTEWTVFIARAIMQRADCISIYDLYLLHEIMMRCQEDA